MATPIGEDSWLAYLEETVRNASDLEKRVHSVEVHKRAIAAEPGSLRLWLAYCNYFWSLWENSQSPHAGWSDEEQSMGRELFSFGAALDLWQQGYESIKYRLDDSHVLWNRWVGLEMDLLSNTKTPNGIKRITHLYRDRLLTPHMTWDETSQSFSSFLSEYNRAGWEDAMKDITTSAQNIKRLIAARDPFEIKLKKAIRDANPDAHKAVLLEYLEWEMLQSKRNNDNPEIGMDLCRGLYARALTGPFARDESVWHEYITHLSASVAEPQAPVDLLEVLRRAVEHCPWSGELWSRNILCAEEAKLAFAEIESIKHAATSQDLLYKNGMESMIEMYVAWCGFLKRKAMDASAGDEAVDVADVGLAAAIEDVGVVGKRLYGNDFQGDPKFRLERIYIQYLTEKKGAVDEARTQWNKLASVQIHADNYDFWLLYYLWEMLIFWSRPNSFRSPTPSGNPAGFRVPSHATSVLARAVARTNIDWPEKVLEVYLQHCNDYEPPTSLRHATDRVQKAFRALRKRREREQQEKEEAYSAYYNEQQPSTVAGSSSINDSKRKREELGAGVEVEGEMDGARKRHKNDASHGGTQPFTSEAADTQDQSQKRDREHTTILVDNLPHDTTQTKLRQYFREYGRIKNITALVRNDKSQSSTALIEFSTPDEAISAQLRDGKYMGQSQLSVASGHDLTVYVANYPPAADDAYIRNLFQDCGELLSIRWPSLKVNAHRRFCYVSFRSREASAQAVKKDGMMIEGKFCLVSKYSDPNQKRKREGALAEGREVHINALDKSVKESDLRDVFSKCGSITRINIPQTLSGTNRGFAFLDFETAEQAQEAVDQLNNTKFRGQIMQVELSKDTKVKPSARSTQTDHRSPSVSSAVDTEGDAAMIEGEDVIKAKVSPSEIRDRTISLLGLPDTVNDARVRALVEPLGTVVSLVLQPRHGSAKIEFADASTAGKASLGLDRIEFEGSTLRTGSIDDLHQTNSTKAEGSNAKAKGTTKPSKGLLAPPAIVRRPGTQRLGPKRGLGFVNNKKEAGDATTESSIGGSNGSSMLKSNADFRALFVASKETANGDGGDKAAEEEKRD